MNLKQKREIIMDHYLNPTWRKNLGSSEGEVLYSTVCADNLKMEIKWINGKLESAFWDGQGCAVFSAATDILLGLVQGKPTPEAKLILGEYEKMLEGERFEKTVVQDLVAFRNVKKDYNRLPCAKLVVNYLRKFV